MSNEVALGNLIVAIDRKLLCCKPPICYKSRNVKNGIPVFGCHFVCDNNLFSYENVYIFICIKLKVVFLFSAINVV